MKLVVPIGHCDSNFTSLQSQRALYNYGPSVVVASSRLELAAVAGSHRGRPHTDTKCLFSGSNCSETALNVRYQSPGVVNRATALNWRSLEFTPSRDMY